MTRLIAVASGKGGVGKTTTTINLGAALARHNKNVIIVDANLTTPNVGLHLGLHGSLTTLNDVLEGNASILDAIYPHKAGFRVIPAGISLKHLRTSNPERLWDIVLDLFGSSDVVLLDTPAGLEHGTRSALDAGEEVLVVTNPELPAVTDALKTVRMAHRAGAHVLGAVLNKHRGELGEIKKHEIEALLEVPILATIPHDDNVRKAIRLKHPVVAREPNSPASHAYMKLAADLMGLTYDVPTESAIVRALKKVFGN